MLPARPNAPPHPCCQCSPLALAEAAGDRAEALAEARRATRGLIVAASLLDNLPNLAGLCRTCESLSVEALALPSRAAAGEGRRMKRRVWGTEAAATAAAAAVAPVAPVANVAAGAAAADAAVAVVMVVVVMVGLWSLSLFLAVKAIPHLRGQGGK
eukprot:350512-Chlamydomonas_euryale.AAC.3